MAFSFIEAICNGVNGLRIYNVRWYMVAMVARRESKNYFSISPCCHRSVSVDGVGSHAFDCFCRDKNDLDIIFLLYTLRCLYISIMCPRFLQYRKVGSFNFFSLSGYSRLPTANKFSCSNFHIF